MLKYTIFYFKRQTLKIWTYGDSLLPQLSETGYYKGINVVAIKRILFLL